MELIVILSIFFFLSYNIAAQPKPKRVKQPKKIRDASEYDDDAAWAVPGLTQDEMNEDGKTVKNEVKVRTCTAPYFLRSFVHIFFCS